MCGFVGFFPSINEGTDKNYLYKMLSPINHRGPDSTGIFRNKNIAMGHHRLSIIDLKGGNQPLVDQSSGDCLVFNGEIYGYKNHAENLRKKGISLKDNSDTEVLFKLIINYGVYETLQKIDGMFAFVYYKASDNTIWLARDRVGEKPLYFTQYNNIFLFGSEIKTITSNPLFNGSINFSAINDYLNLDYIPFNKTLIHNVNKVLPGECIKYSNNKINNFKYWQYNQKNKNTDSKSSCINKLDKLLDNSVKTRLIADVPVGLFLSGGIDSSLIAHYCKKYSSNIKTFTIKMEEKTYDESNYAENVAKHLGLKNICHTFDNIELLNSLSAIEEKLDEPINDPSILPTYMVSNLAKEHVKVALSGDGADELFGGYAPFKYISAMRILNYFPKSLGNFLYHNFSKLSHEDNYMNLIFLIKHISKGIGHKPNQQTFRWMSSFASLDVKRVFMKDFVERHFSEKNIIDVLSTNYAEEDPNLHNQILKMFFENYLPNDILAKVDRASMYNSLEVRSPFLDKDLIEFAGSLNNNLKIKGETKYILRELCKNKIPKNIVKRKKHGFAIPLSEILRTSLKEKISDTLTARNLKILDFVNRDALIEVINNHNNGKDNRKIIWSLYILEKCIQKTLINC